MPPISTSTWYQRGAVRPGMRTRSTGSDITTGMRTGRKMLMNQELHDLFVADQTEPRRDTASDTPEYWLLRERDAQRLQRVSELLAQGGVSALDDYFQAALIFQHGKTLQDIWQAHELARKAAEKRYH